MARPGKRSVDWFPHQCVHGRTMSVLMARYQNDGYAVLFRTFERLGSIDGHALNLGEDLEAEHLATTCYVSQDRLVEIISLLVKLGTFDKTLWEQNHIVWSDSFLSGISGVYQKRHTIIPAKPRFLPENPPIAPVMVEKTATSRVEGVEKRREQEIHATAVAVIGSSDDAGQESIPTTDAPPTKAAVKPREVVSWLLPTWKDFREMRKKIRSPMTERAENLLLSKLENICGEDQDMAIRVVEQSIERGWRGLFPLRDNSGGGGS